MKVAIILAVYFAIGGAATAYAASRAAAGKRRSYWVKYFVYLLLTVLMVSVIQEAPALLPFLVAGVGIGGLRELVIVHRGIGAARWFIPVFVYLICAALLFLLSLRAETSPTFLITYVLVVSFDGFSQISGQLIRSRKLMPRVSPGKTVAGLVGGLAATVLTGAILGHPQSGPGAVFGAGVAIAAFTGDALASALKRRLGLKDFSNLIPGHGGILDRFDSILMAGAVVAVYYFSQTA